MTEEQAIERIIKAIRQSAEVIDRADDEECRIIAEAAWNEMKAISAELAEKHGTSTKVFIDAQLDALQ